MNWEAIGAAGEILGALAVIASLLFIGVQIRNNTRATQAAASHNVTDTFISIAKSIAADPELARIWAQQTTDISVLSTNDLQRLIPINVIVLKSFEDAFHHRQMGQMSDEMWDGWQALILTICNYAGIRHYWEQRKTFFSRTFQEFVDNPPPIESISTMSEFIDSAIGHAES